MPGALALWALVLAGPPATSEATAADPTGESSLYAPSSDPSPTEAPPEPPKPKTATREVGDPGLPGPTPAPQPIQIIPAPTPKPIPAPNPAAAPGLVPIQLAPPPPPPSGTGRLVGGSFSIALGLGAIAAIGIESARAGGDPRTAASTLVPLSLVGLGIGGYLLVRGAKARSNLLDWRAFSGERERPSGSGLIVGGILSTAVGTVSLASAAVGTATSTTQAERSRDLGLWIVSAATLSSGAIELGFGVVRRRRYHQWRAQTYLGSVGASLQPSLALLPRGAGLGLRGKF